MSSVSDKYHTNLANYFQEQVLFFDGELQKKPHVRKCMEQPWQQTKGEMWNEVTDTLCNLDFIQAKACAKQTYDLVKDYHSALDGLPEYQPEKEKERKRQERLDKYTRDLIACAESKISRFDLEVPESITPWTEEQIDAEIEWIKTSPTRADKLKDFINFLGHESSNLQNYANDFAWFTHQQAWNFVMEGPVGKAAEKLSRENAKFLLRRIQLDISVMLTPVSVILTPFAENGSKNRKYDNITFFFLNSLLLIQCGGKYAPNDLKLHRQLFLPR